MADLDPLLGLLRHLLPRELPGGELSLADIDPPLHVNEAGALLVVLRTVTREDGMIVDLREQAVALGRFDAHPLARWQAYLEGTLRAAPAIVTALGGLAAILPGDLFAYAQVLDDAALASADDFLRKLTDPEQLAAWKIGSTRFGGDPDLPPMLAWPEVEGVPLVFVAQLDLAEIADHEAAAELPRSRLKRKRCCPRSSRPTTTRRCDLSPTCRSISRRLPSS